jgi:FkbM family methyltransferase
MQFIKSTLNRFPRFKGALKSVYYFFQGQGFYYFFQGLPPISYSKITAEIINECVGKSNPTILEIGCNDGTHTLWFNEMFEYPTIYCFEPDPRAIGRFKSKVGQRSNINLFEIALSDLNGTTTFYQSSFGNYEKLAERYSSGLLEKMPEGWDLSGSIRKPKEHLEVHPGVSFEQAISVKTKTLDTWYEEHGIDIIDFIWMDVQGAELDVFRGGKNALSKTRFIYTEYNNQELYEGQANLKQLLRHLETFEVIILYKGDVLLRNKQFKAG